MKRVATVKHVSTKSRGDAAIRTHVVQEKRPLVTWKATYANEDRVYSVSLPAVSWYQAREEASVVFCRMLDGAEVDRERVGLEQETAPKISQPSPPSG